MSTLAARESATRARLARRRIAHRAALRRELERLTAAAADLGARRVILFGSAARGDVGLSSDLDLLIVWDSSLPFLDRTAEVYRRLSPRIAADLLVYTTAEFERMRDAPFIRRALAEGKVLYEA